MNPVLITLLFWGISAGALADLSTAPGMRYMTAMAPERGVAVPLTLWYPTTSPGAAEPIGGSPVFEGTPAIGNAPVAGHKLPVILLAHGGLRANPSLGNWIAASLALRGYFVVAVQAPPLDAANPVSAVAELWLRPADLSAAMTAVEGDFELTPYLDLEKVAAVGFLRGGTSALALAGARFDADRYRQSCDGVDAGPDCAWFAKNGIDLRSFEGVDAGMIERDHLDGRIKAVVAVDPELSGSFAPASLEGIGIPVDIINLGQAGAMVPGLDASALAKDIPAAGYTSVPEATPFSAFSLCTAQGIILLEDEGETICSERSGLSREVLHARISQLIGDALRRRGIQETGN